MTIELQHPKSILLTKTALSGNDVIELVKILQTIHNEIKRLMTTVTGEHESDPWKFVDKAIHNKKFGNKITKKAAYCFHMQCRYNQMIDFAISTSLPEDGKASSESQIDPPCKKKKVELKKENDNTERIIHHFNTIENNRQRSITILGYESNLRDLRREVDGLEKRRLKLTELKYKFPGSKDEIEYDIQILLNEISTKKQTIEDTREQMNLFVAQNNLGQNDQ